MTFPVSIIIPVFNQVAYTKCCLESLIIDPYVKENCQIVIVNNGSTDETQEVISTFCKTESNIKLINLTENPGFSGSCNTGAASSEGEELVFLNNDTLVEKNWLKNLRLTLRMDSVGLVGPKLLYPNSRTINSAGYVYRKEVGAFYHIYHHYPEDFSGVNRRREFQALLGACYLIRRSTFDKAGMFSEFGFEDIDLCLKVRKLGLKVMYEPKSLVYHHGSVTLQNSPKGSIPPTDGIGFSKMWSGETLQEDDDVFYREDGLCFESMKNGVVNLSEVVSSSDECLKKASLLIEQKKFETAITELQNAIEIYLGNQEAYEEIIFLYLEMGRLEEAINYAEKMCRHVTGSFGAQLFLAKLYKTTKNELLAQKTLKNVLNSWDLPEQLRIQALEMGSP